MSGFLWRRLSRRQSVTEPAPGHCAHHWRPLGAEKAHDLADRREVEALRIGARRLLFADAAAEPASTSVSSRCKSSPGTASGVAIAIASPPRTSSMPPRTAT